MTRRGMTLVELVVALTIMAILANLALPAVATLRRKAEAARVIADVHAIRIAALDNFASEGRFPPSGSWGQTPPGLQGSLPPGFQFKRKGGAAGGGVDYCWRRFSLPNGMPAAPGQTVLVGVEVRTNDAKLMVAVKGVYKGSLAFGTSTQVLFVVE